MLRDALSELWVSTGLKARMDLFFSRGTLHQGRPGIRCYFLIVVQRLAVQWADLCVLPVPERRKFAQAPGSEMPRNEETRPAQHPAALHLEPRCFQEALLLRMASVTRHDPRGCPRES